MTTSPDARPLEAVREVWDNATNAVCQEMQAREMCNCPDGECLAAKVEPSPADFTAALPHMGGVVAIKPLEWERIGGDFYRAPSPLFGNIRIEGFDGRDFVVCWSVPGFCDTFTEGRFPTPEAAKAAALADYEARIRSALVASPAPAVTEAVAWRRRGKFKWFYRDSPPPDDDASWQPLAASPADDRPREVEKALEPFQARVHKWMMACFNDEIAFSRTERNHRFLEEALELVQAMGCTANEAYQLVEYVFGRPEGEPTQEVGGVLVCLAALCTAAEIDMDAAGETELARIWTKVEKIRAKHAAKPQFSPLPGPSEPALVSLRSEREG